MNPTTDDLAQAGTARRQRSRALPVRSRKAIDRLDMLLCGAVRTGLWLWVSMLVILTVWVVISSLKTSGEVFTKPFGLPKTPQWRNYQLAWSVSGFGEAAFSSVVVVAAAAFLMMAIATPASYVLARVDWGLLLVFMLMFIDLRLVAQLGVVRQALDALALSTPMHLYWAGIGVSQIISNVPAAILLAEYSHDWPMIAFAVSVGGFGTLIGSLANLIALRMLGDRRAWWVFQAYSMPFLLAAAGIVYAWLMWLR